MIDFIINNIWLIAFFLWGLPLTYYRSKFRKMVYQTDSWTINIKPLFGKEIKALATNMYPEDRNYMKFRKFYAFYLAVYLILFAAYFSFNNSNSMAKIEVGSEIPQFTLQNQFGDTFNIDNYIGKKNLVIYFYPKDDTPGCTKEACSFRDQFAVFEDSDAMIIGISSQSVESHLKFAEKHRLNYTLLADVNKEVRKLFGVPADLFGLIPGRVTYIVNKEGKVVYVFNSQTNAEKHVDEALVVIKDLK